jgi:hypothetical protein
VDVDAWLAQNPEAMFSCPNQPGELRITRAACAKRHAMAQKKSWQDVGGEPFRVFIIKLNLRACRDCEIGARNCALAEQAA